MVAEDAGLRLTMGSGVPIRFKGVAMENRVIAG